MLRLNTCYSYTKARKMTAKKRFSIKDIIYSFICILIIIGIYSHFDFSASPKEQVSTSVVHAQDILPQVIKVNEDDKRVAKLQSFLESKNSPLAPYAQNIITESDNNAIDWTKIVAISGMESHYCTQLPQGSHNCWGLGGSDLMYFNSWDDAIKYMANLLGNQYKTDELEGIKTRYCPQSDGCNPMWASIVSGNSTDILKGAK